MKSVGVYFDGNETHVLVFNAEGSIFEHLIKKEVTNEDLAMAQLKRED